MPRLVRAAAIALLALAALLLAGSASALSSGVKLKKLSDRAAADPRRPIRFDGALFEQSTSKPRNYSVLVVLTALSNEHGCALCKDFDNELRLVTAAWHNAKVPNRLFIGSLDFKDGRDVFQKMGLRSVPLVIHYPPTEGPNAKVISTEYETYDLQRKGASAEDVARFVEQITGTKVNVVRPTDWGKIFGRIAALAIIGGTLAFAWRRLAWFFGNKIVWTVLSVGWIGVMTSGYMWNQIRHPPYTGVKDGRPEIFAPGFQSQFVLETQIIMLVYIGTSVFFTLLAVFTPDIAETRKRYIAAYVSLGCFVALFSWLLRIFRVKNGGYPFRLL